MPASLCGIFGLKPTYGRLARTGTYPFVASLDHLGPFARDVADLAAAWDALQGQDPADPAQGRWPVEPATPAAASRASTGCGSPSPTTISPATAMPEAFAAVAAVAAALGVERRVTVPEAARARAAAFLITAAEGANLHLPDLRTRPQDFDPGDPRPAAGRQP